MTSEFHSTITTEDQTKGILKHINRMKNLQTILNDHFGKFGSVKKHPSKN